MKRIALMIAVAGLIMTRAVWATEYYVSPSGDDGQNGQSAQTAWKTAAKVNASKFAPGDSILFERGGNWHEALIASSDGDDQHPITYADYGDSKATKPTFWGSDVVAPGAITGSGNSTYTIQTSVLPTGHAYYVFADHKFLAFATDAGNMPADSFVITGGTITVKTAGADPRSGSPVISMTDRAQGVNGDSSLICSNGHNCLLFRNLIGRETAAAPAAGGLPDAYVYRIMGSRNIRMMDCDAVAGGKHHVGVINTTDFVGTRIHASGCIPGLGYGNAGAFVSFSDQSRSNDTSQWIDCLVDDFQPNEQSFITHGPGLGNLLIQNLTSIGCGLGIGMDNPNEKILIKSGLLTGPTCDIYGSHITIDGLRITRDAKIDLFGDGNIVENCIDAKSSNPQGSIVVRGKGNIIRFCTLDHPANAGPCIGIQSSAANTKIIGNLFTGGASPSVSGADSAGLVLDYNGFDTSGGAAPRGLDYDAHLAKGDPKFADESKGDYTLAAGSFAIGKVPASATDEPDHDALGNPRPAAGPFDIGACQTQSAR